MYGAVPFYIYRPHFFANPWVDAVRSLCVVLAVLLLAWIVRVVREQNVRGRLTAGQVSRFAALALAAVSIAYTEVIVQGTALTWRLPINLLALGFGFHGIYAMRREQKRR